MVVFGCNIAQPVAERRLAFARRGALCASPYHRPVKQRDGMQVRATRRCALGPRVAFLVRRLDCGELGWRANIPNTMLHGLDAVADGGRNVIMCLFEREQALPCSVWKLPNCRMIDESHKQAV